MSDSVSDDEWRALVAHDVVAASLERIAGHIEAPTTRWLVRELSRLRAAQLEQFKQADRQRTRYYRLPDNSVVRYVPPMEVCDVVDLSSMAEICQHVVDSAGTSLEAADVRGAVVSGGALEKVPYGG